MSELISLGALLIAVLALAGTVVAFSRLRRLQARMDAAEQGVRQVGEYFQGLSAGALGQGEHLARVEADLSRLRDRMEQVATSGNEGAAFNQAIRMARKGAPAREIMETCGLSQVEADLVVLLHKEGA